MAAPQARQVDEAPQAPRPQAPRSAPAGANLRPARGEPAGLSAPPRPLAARSDRSRRNRLAREHAALFLALERNWTLMAPVLGIALVLNGFATLAVPPAASVLLGLLAVAIAAATPIAARIEREHCNSAAQRFAVLFAIVGAPMLLFGVALALWTVRANADWSHSLGLLVLCSALSAVILNRRVIALIIGQVGLWTGATLVVGTGETWAGLGLGAVLGIVLGRRESRANAATIRNQIDRERAQLRAEERRSSAMRTSRSTPRRTAGGGGTIFTPPTCTAMPRNAASWNRTCATRWPTMGWNCTTSRSSIP